MLPKELQRFYLILKNSISLNVLVGFFWSIVRFSTLEYIRKVGF